MKLRRGVFRKSRSNIRVIDLHSKSWKTQVIKSISQVITNIVKGCIFNNHIF